MHGVITLSDATSYGPRHAKTCLMPYANICEQQRCRSACASAVAEQTGLSHTWSKMFEDTFSRNAAHMIIYLNSYFVCLIIFANI